MIFGMSVGTKTYSTYKLCNFAHIKIPQGSYSPAAGRRKNRAPGRPESAASNPGKGTVLSNQSRRRGAGRQARAFFSGMSISLVGAQLIPGNAGPRQDGPQSGALIVRWFGMVRKSEPPPGSGAAWRCAQPRALDKKTAPPGRPGSAAINPRKGTVLSNPSRRRGAGRPARASSPECPQSWLPW
jgi:hypothetical protein